MINTSQSWKFLPGRRFPSDRDESRVKFYRPVEIEKALPALGLEVLDVLGLIQDQVAPGLASERLVILKNQLVGRDAHVERIRLGPSLRKRKNPSRLEGKLCSHNSAGCVS